jgi:hypothetical protein
MVAHEHGDTACYSNVHAERHADAYSYAHAFGYGY